LAVKVALSCALLAFVLLRVDLGSLGRTLATSDFGLVAVAVLVTFAAHALNTLKWQVLLAGPGSHLQYLELLKLNFIGMFYNIVLPGQVGGEIIKSVKLARMGVSGTLSAVSVLADRVTGLFALMTLGAVGALLMPARTPEQAAIVPWLVGLALALAPVTFGLVTGAGLGWVTSLLGRLPLWAAAGKRRALLVERLYSERKPPSSLLAPLALSAIFQGAIVLASLLLCGALGISVGYVELLWVVAVVSLLQSLPISVAGLGVREGAFVYLLHILNVPSADALALSLLTFGVQVLLALAGGVVQLLGTAQARKAVQ
jgi:hypothetical protein